MVILRNIEMAARGAGAKLWCFTWYAGGGVEDRSAQRDVLRGRAELLATRHLTRDVIKCGAWQIEECPETHRLHIQGFAALITKQRLSWWRLRFPGISMRKCSGTEGQNWDYCTKEESRVEGPWKIGTPARGKRSDLARSREVLDKEGMAGVYREHWEVGIRYHRGLTVYLRSQFKDRDPAVAPEIRIYWGTPGTGKSRRAMYEAGPDAFSLEAPGDGSRLWWDRYQGQKNIVIDEFYGWIKYSVLLKILDRYKLTVEIKGDSLPFAGCRFWITSNQDPMEWYPRVSDQRAFHRRLRDFATVERMDTGVWTPPVVMSRSPSVQALGPEPEVVDLSSPLRERRGRSPLSIRIPSHMMESGASTSPMTIGSPPRLSSPSVSVGSGGGVCHQPSPPS